MKRHSDRPARPRAVALLVTLLALMLMITVAAELTMTTSIDSIRVSRRVNALQHRLAVDSTLRWVNARLATDRLLLDELDRLGRATVQLTLGRCQVHGDITDDAAKLDVTGLDQASQQRRLTRTLARLGRAYDLPRVRIKLRPLHREHKKVNARYYAFDQLFADPPPGAFFPPAVGVDGSFEAAPVWSDVLTLWGDGRIDVRRVAPAVLDTALSDLGRGLGQTILSDRKQSDLDRNFLPEAMAGLDGTIREEVAERLAFDLHRYALTVETAIGGDRRLWYVVATIDDASIHVHYKGQIQW